LKRDVKVRRTIGLLLITWSAFTVLPLFGIDGPGWLPRWVFLVMVAGGPVAFGAATWVLSGFPFLATLAWALPLVAIQDLLFFSTPGGSMGRNVAMAGIAGIVLALVFSQTLTSWWIRAVQATTARLKDRRKASGRASSPPPTTDHQV
jgi:hypothetical protein